MSKINLRVNIENIYTQALYTEGIANNLKSDYIFVTYHCCLGFPILDVPLRLLWG